MIRLLRNWWWARQRAIDLRILWPQCKALAPDIDHARAAFSVHAFNDPAWACYYEGDLVRVIGELAESDDDAVDRFAIAMKAKLAKKRAEGCGGWNEPTQCSTEALAGLLRRQVAKGDPVDVGNFAMMIWNRGGATNEGAGDNHA